MAKTPYDTDLDRNPANFQPLTPLGFLERAAAMFPDAHRDHPRAAAAHLRGILRARAAACLRAWPSAASSAATACRCMLANTPAMLECHYGVPMTQGVLNTLNTRLDAAIIAFSLDHAEAKVVIIDREFSKVMKEALALCKAKPLVIDYDDPEYSGAGERLGEIEYEDFVAHGDPDFALVDAGRRMGRHRAQLHLGHHRRSEGRGLSPPRRASAGDGQCHHLRHAAASGLSVDAADVPLQRLVLPLDDLDRRRHACLPARGARGRDVRRDRHPQGDASVRRADRDGDAAQRDRGREEAAAACGRVRHRRGAAARGGAGGDESRRLQRHARLRPDRMLRPRRGQRMARRLGRAAAARAGGEEGAPGRALSGAGGARRARSRHAGAGRARRRERSAK